MLEKEAHTLNQPKHTLLALFGDKKDGPTSELSSTSPTVSSTASLSPKPEKLIRIDSGYFCAAVVLYKGKVIKAAPILSYMNGLSEKRVLDYCRRKEWITLHIS